jgi:hypothetical protein
MASAPKPKNVTATIPATADIKIDEKANTEEQKKIDLVEVNQWLESLYNPNLLSQEKLEYLGELLKYAGFNRFEVLKDLKKLTTTLDETIEIILACALRGPVQAAQTRLTNGKTISQMGIRSSGLKGQKGISCARVTAATADLAAFYLKRLNAPKRLNVDCPGWLQFPSAGSIKLPEELRQQHIEFSKKFSGVIGGVFNEQIYMQMVANAYLDPKLKLFD